MVEAQNCNVSLKSSGSMEAETKVTSPKRSPFHRRFQDALWGQPARAEHELRQLVELIIEAALETGKSEETIDRGLAQGGAP
jgi:hypothetical protein